MDYRKVGSLPSLQPQTLTSDPEARYWQQFGTSSVFVKEFSPINAINFIPPVASSSSRRDDDPTASTSLASSTALNKFAVTSATRVQIFNMRTSKITRTIGRFNDVARSGAFRSDGKLLVAGDDSGLVQVFDASSRTVLRQMRGHQLPVHVTRFSCNPTQVLSASDDRTVRLWDLAEGKELRQFLGHNDYVRCAYVSPDRANVLLSGSYDGTVRLWDERMAENGGCAMVMKHRAPVEDVAIFPTGGGGAALSVGGPALRSWDLMMGGRCANAVSNHSKTITSLAISMMSGAEADVELGLGGLRVLTAGLDQLVKVYDPAKGYRVVHTMRYPSPILCLGISPDETQLVTGMADGTLSIRKRVLRAAESQHRLMAAQSKQSLQYFLPAAEITTTTTATSDDAGADALAAATTNGRAQPKLSVIKDRQRRRKLQTYDKLLKAFRYQDALDEVLRKGVQAEITFALLHELRNRSVVKPNGQVVSDGLRRAIAGRGDVTLEPLLKFLLRHCTNARWTPLVRDCMDVVMDVYADVLGQSPVIDELFAKIWRKVHEEVVVQQQVQQVRGALEMLVNGNAIA